MVFLTLLKLHQLHYDSYPHAPSPSEAYTESRHDHLTVGIGCGPSGNNCAVEGSGQRGPGPIPLPGKIRAKFRYGSGAHIAGSRITVAAGSLYDLRSARAAIRDGGNSGDSSGAGSSLAPPHTHGFGKSAYSAAQPQMFSLSGAHKLLLSGSHSSGSSSPDSHRSFFGVLPNPKPTTDVSAVWGGSGQPRSADQFSSTASMIPQSANSRFHLSIRSGFVDPTSVAIRGGDGGDSSVGVGHFSWNSAKLMDSNYHLLVKPKTANVSDAWSQSAPNAQFSSASMLPQSGNSSFQFGLRHGVVDMSTVAVTNDNYSNTAVSDYRSSGGRAQGTVTGHSFYARLGTHGRSNINGLGSSSQNFSQSVGSGRGGYSWSARQRHGTGMGDWLIAPEVAQWLPEGIGTDLGV